MDIGPWIGDRQEGQWKTTAQTLSDTWEDERAMTTVNQQFIEGAKGRVAAGKR